MGVAHQKFQELAVGDPSITKAHLERLDKVLGQHYDAFRSKRLAEASAVVETMLGQAHQKLSAGVV